MLKRVNIQYSIELEELPNEVDRIYKTAKNIFGELSIPEKNGKELLTADVLKDLDLLRKNLSNLDRVLNDVTGIIGSYINYELSLISQQNAMTQGTEEHVEHPAEMS